MAKNSDKRSKVKRHHRLSLEQQQEKEKEGRCQRLLCDIVKLRIFKYILKQPASFLFIISLFLIAVTLPLLGVFIANAKELPDLDSMQNWNAYIGKLGQNDFCFALNKTNISFKSVHQPSASSSSGDSKGHNETIGVWLNFTVNQTAMANTPRLLYGTFSGKDVKTQIKDSPGGNRTDEKIKLEVLINVTALLQEEHPKACDNSSKCTVMGCLLITALSSSVPMKLPQVHKNYAFSDKIIKIDEDRKPPTCSIEADFGPLNDSTMINQFHLSSEKSCTRDVDVVRSTKSISKGHGLIYIKLRDEDKKRAAYHMYLAALAVAALGLAFALGIALTDRPTDPKASQE